MVPIAAEGVVTERDLSVALRQRLTSTGMNLWAMVSDTGDIIQEIYIDAGGQHARKMRYKVCVGCIPE